LIIRHPSSQQIWYRIRNCWIVKSNYIAEYSSSPINYPLKPVGLFLSGVGLSIIYCIFEKNNQISLPLAKMLIYLTMLIHQCFSTFLSIHIVYEVCMIYVNKYCVCIHPYFQYTLVFYTPLKYVNLTKYSVTYLLLNEVKILYLYGFNHLSVFNTVETQHSIDMIRRDYQLNRLKYFAIKHQLTLFSMIITIELTYFTMTCFFFNYVTPVGLWFSFFSLRLSLMSLNCPSGFLLIIICPFRGICLAMSFIALDDQPFHSCPWACFSGCFV